ncbi:MAG: DUF4097 family beta strand repeat protein [Spirochaetales bacterium]|nr:DUF4097 family beta strand repeat protein [Spirochaetales bacterium]
MIRRVIVTLLSAAVFLIGCSGTSESLEEELAFNGIEKLIVDGSFFEVEVAGHSKDSVDTEVSIPERIRRSGVTVSRVKTGSVLEVKVEGRKRKSGFLSFEQPSITISVPFDTELEITTSSGSLSVDEVSGDSINLSATSGRISISECETDLNAASTSGRLMVVSSMGPKMLSSTSGNIETKDSDGDIEAESTSGKQTYDNIIGSINARSTSGKMSIADSRGIIELRSSSGNLKGEGVAVTGNSSFHTSSGSIDINFTNDLDEFTMDLESSSGKINAGRTSAKGSVVTGSGAIMIRGESSSGRQNYR